jgi:transcriptional regulator with XRE-family HTH domain
MPADLHPLVVALVARRRQLGWSQMATAHKVGVDPARISHWEAGSRQPQLANVTRWAEVLGCRVGLIPLEETDDR